MAIRPSACRSVSSAPPVPAHVREVASGATWMPLQSIKVSATPSQFICSNCNAVAGYSIQLASLSPTCNRWPKASNRAESRATTGPAPKRGLCDYSFKVAHYSFFDTSRRSGFLESLCHRQAQAIRRVPDRPETRGDADSDDPATMRFVRCGSFLHESYRRASCSPQSELAWTCR